MRFNADTQRPRPQHDERRRKRNFRKWSAIFVHIRGVRATLDSDGPIACVLL